MKTTAVVVPWIICFAKHGLHGKLGNVAGNKPPAFLRKLKTFIKSFSNATEACVFANYFAKGSIIAKTFRISLLCDV